MSDKIPFNRRLINTGEFPKSGRIEDYWVTEVIENVFSKSRSAKEKKNSKFRFYDPEYLIKTFGLKSFEFGNWLNQEDRYVYMAGCAYAMKDFCDIHKIPYSKFGINGLSVSFGARGSSSALAHFEPGFNVINLTRHRSITQHNEIRELFGQKPLSSSQYDSIKYNTKNGVGSFGHEYGHAFDFMIGQKDKNLPHNFATESIKAISYKSSIKTKDGLTDKKYTFDGPKNISKSVKPFYDVMEALMYVEKKTTSGDTYYIPSEWYEKLLSNIKSNKSYGDYWKKPIEIFARSFEVYLSMRCKEAKLTESYLKKKKYDFWVYPSEEFMKSSGAYERFGKLISSVFKTASTVKKTAKKETNKAKPTTTNKTNYLGYIINNIGSKYTVNGAVVMQEIKTLKKAKQIVISEILTGKVSVLKVAEAKKNVDKIKTFFDLCKQIDKPIRLEWSEGFPEENLFFDNLKGLEKKLKTIKIPKSGYEKNKIWFVDFTNTWYRVDIGKKGAGDFDHTSETLADHLKDKYEIDFSKYK